MPRGKKRKKTPYQLAKEKAWKAFSLYIRRRDRGTCFTCGLTKDPKEQQAGHLFPRQVGGNALFFNEKAVHCQCFGCNITYGGNGALYQSRIREVYGDETYEELEKMARQESSTKFTTEGLNEMAAHYTKLADEFVW